MNYLGTRGVRKIGGGGQGLGVTYRYGIAETGLELASGI